MTIQEKIELNEFYRACDNLMNEEPFYITLLGMYYETAKATKPSKSRHCKCCIYCIVGKGCLIEEKKRLNGNYCWKAMNTYILQKGGLYGEKIRASTRINRGHTYSTKERE